MPYCSFEFIRHPNLTISLTLPIRVYLNRLAILMALYVLGTEILNIYFKYPKFYLPLCQFTQRIHMMRSSKI